MNSIIRIKKLHPAARIPTRATPDSLGLDLHACIMSETGKELKITLPPRVTRAVPTGLACEITDFSPGKPRGVFVFVRSGHAKRGISLGNGVGVIDPDYRGEIVVLLQNHGHETQWIEHGERFAQLLVMPVIMPDVEEVDQLTSTDRGEKGFGSSGR